MSFLISAFILVAKLYIGYILLILTLALIGGILGIISGE